MNNYLSKPFNCEVKGCFKKFNTYENLSLHKKYFHNSKEENKNISLNQRKMIALKNKMKDICFEDNDLIKNYENEKVEKYSVGKCIYEDNKGNIINEKMFLSLEKENTENNVNIDINKNNSNKQRIIVGYISNGLP